MCFDRFCAPTKTDSKASTINLSLLTCLIQRTSLSWGLRRILCNVPHFTSRATVDLLLGKYITWRAGAFPLLYFLNLRQHQLGKVPSKHKNMTGIRTRHSSQLVQQKDTNTANIAGNNALSKWTVIAFFTQLVRNTFQFVSFDSGDTWKQPKSSWHAIGFWLQNRPTAEMPSNNNFLD